MRSNNHNPSCLFTRFYVQVSCFSSLLSSLLSFVTFFKLPGGIDYGVRESGAKSRPNLRKLEIISPTNNHSMMKGPSLLIGYVDTMSLIERREEKAVSLR